MNTFLSELAEDICKQNPDGLQDLCVVFQNRRAALYFKRCLAEKSNKPFWLPAVLTIEEFVHELHPVQILEPVILLFEFYSVYRRSGGSDNFERFSQWAELLLKDFDDIDSYLVPPDKFFSHLNEVKAIEQWDPEGASLTEFQRQYLRFWESLKGLYLNLRSQLTDNRMAYKGMAFRQVAESIEARISEKSWRRIIFAGFNALSLSEEKIFKTLIKMGKASVVWDMDKYYVQNEWHEAGHYIRKYLKEWKFRDPKWEKDFLTSEKKNIHVIAVAKNVGQAKVAGDIVAKLSLNNEPNEHTAVVLADEALLFPMLHALPEPVKDINVSMGMSLKFTPLFSLIDSLFELQHNARVIESDDNNREIKFHYRSLIAVLSHPLVEWIDTRHESRPFRKLIRHLHENNILFISTEEIETFVSTIDSKYPNIFLRYWNNTPDAIHHLSRTVSYIDNTLQSNFLTQRFEQESFKYFTSILNRLEMLLNKYDVPIDVKSFHTLYMDLLSSTRIPFVGEPLTGLQIMGVLETRTIDFENMIILSANENILPAAKVHGSMIPLDIKREFGLPTYRERDAIFAYNFYRSIQRAKNIYLIYNTETDEFGRGERSRFVTQLMIELPKHNPHLTNEIHETFLHIPLSLDNTQHGDPIEVPKNNEILKCVEQIFTAGIYPTALKTYIRCPLLFHLRYIAKLKPPGEIEENIESNTFGSVVHMALKELFTPYLEKQIQRSDIDAMKPNVTEYLRQAFDYYLPNADINHGNNHLLYRVAIKLIHKFLEREKIRIHDYQTEGSSITITGLETPVSYDLKLQLNGEEKILKLKGIVDRIDRSADKYTVIDYKTGKVQDTELEVPKLIDVFSDPALEKSFQLLSYAYIYHKNSGDEAKKLFSAVYPFKKLSEGLKPVLVNGSGQLTSDIFEEFETQLKSLTAQIMDTAIPFYQTHDSERCRNCDFISLCRRD